MSDNGDVRNDDKLDAYLDGQLSPEEMRAFEQQLSPDIASEVDRQKRIDDSLRRLFRPRTPSLDEINGLLSRSSHARRARSDTSLKPIRHRRRWIAVLAIAGAIAWAIVAVEFRRVQRPEPLFVSQALTQIYLATVAQGFEPYYECREPDRFAYTFEQRQGVPVHLDPMPPGSGMLGLSYSGGLSRHTTVMLCRVDGQPVMVFVDRLSADRPQAAVVDASNGLHIHRAERGGLVMYEVTPFAEARALPYLRVERPYD